MHGQLAMVDALLLPLRFQCPVGGRGPELSHLLDLLPPRPQTERESLGPITYFVADTLPQTHARGCQGMRVMIALVAIPTRGVNSHINRATVAGAHLPGKTHGQRLPDLRASAPRGSPSFHSRAVRASFLISASSAASSARGWPPGQKDLTANIPHK